MQSKQDTTESSKSDSPQPSTSRVELVEKQFSQADRDRYAKRTLVEDECRRLQQLGVMPDVRRIERDVEASLQRVIAREREDGHLVRKRPKKAERIECVKAYARTLGYELIKRPVARKEILPPKPRTRRQAALEARLRFICSVDEHGQQRFPVLAQELMQIGLRARLRMGEFEGLAKADVDAVVSRRMTDIADRLNFSLGDWRP